MSSEGGIKTVIAAPSANIGIAISKFVAFVFTGSSSMLSEAIHSVSDSGDRILLIIGNRLCSLVKVQSVLPEEVALIRSALEESAGVERVIHLQTMHVGPDELLVAAKIAIHDSDSGTQIAKAINDAEIALRTALPSAQYTFLEPDLDFGRQGDSTVLGLNVPDPRL